MVLHVLHTGMPQEGRLPTAPVDGPPPSTRATCPPPWSRSPTTNHACGTGVAVVPAGEPDVGLRPCYLPPPLSDLCRCGGQTLCFRGSTVAPGNMPLTQAVWPDVRRETTDQRRMVRGAGLVQLKLEYRRAAGACLTRTGAGDEGLVTPPLRVARLVPAAHAQRHGGPP